MNLLDKWFLKMSKKAWQNSRGYETSDSVVQSTSGRKSATNVQGKRMDFSIFKADGGYIIQHYVDDSNNNNTKYAVMEKEPKLLIVNSSEDLGAAIDRLILMDALRS